MDGIGIKCVYLVQPGLFCYLKAYGNLSLPNLRGMVVYQGMNRDK